MDSQHFSSQLMFIGTFIILIFESKSNPVNISPRQVAVVEENGDINVTCNVDLESLLWDLVVKMSVHPMTVLLIDPVGLGTCSKSPKTPSNSQLTYRIICDRTNNAVTLQILNVSLADDNISISCILRTNDNKDKWVASTSIRVKVPVKEINIIDPRNVTIIERNVTQFQCLTSPSRPAANITWYKVLSGHEHPMALESSTTKVTNKTGTVLSYTTSYLNYSAHATDTGGMIYCEAKYDNKTIASTRIFLNVTYEPKIETILQKQTMGHSNASSFNFTCIVDSNPFSNIKWTLKGDPKMLQVDYGLNSTLSLTLMECEERQTYVCVADNGIGQSEKEKVVSAESCNIDGNTHQYSDEEDMDTDLVLLTTGPTAALILIVVIVAIIYIVLKRRKIASKEKRKRDIEFQRMDTVQEGNHTESGGERDANIHNSPDVANSVTTTQRPSLPPRPDDINVVSDGNATPKHPIYSNVIKKRKKDTDSKDSAQNPRQLKDRNNGKSNQKNDRMPDGKRNGRPNLSNTPKCNSNQKPKPEPRRKTTRKDLLDLGVTGEESFSEMCTSDTSKFGLGNETEPKDTAEGNEKEVYAQIQQNSFPEQRFASIHRKGVKLADQSPDEENYIEVEFLPSKNEIPIVRRKDQHEKTVYTEVQFTSGSKSKSKAGRKG